MELHGRIGRHWLTLAAVLLVVFAQCLAHAASKQQKAHSRRQLGYRDHGARTPLQQGVLLFVLSGRATHITEISRQLNKPNRASVTAAINFLDSKGNIRAAARSGHGRIEYAGTTDGVGAFDAALGRRGLVEGISDHPDELTDTVHSLSTTLSASNKSRVAVGVWEAPPKATGKTKRKIRLRYLPLPALAACLENPAEPIPAALVVTPETLSVLFASLRGWQSTLDISGYTGLPPGGSTWRTLQSLSARRLVRRKRAGNPQTHKGEAVYAYPLTEAGEWALVLGLIRGGLPEDLFGDNALVGLDPISMKIQLLVDPRANVLSRRVGHSLGQSSVVQTPNRLSVLWTIPDDVPPIHVQAISAVTGLTRINVKNATDSLGQRGFVERIADPRGKTSRSAFVRANQGRRLFETWQRRRGLAPGLVEIAESQLRDEHELAEGIDPIAWLSRELVSGRAAIDLVFPASRWTPEFTSIVLATFMNPHLGLEPMTHAQVLEYTGVGAATVSGALKALCDAGLLERNATPGPGWGAAKWLGTYALKRSVWPILGHVLSLRGYLPSVAAQALATDGAY